MKARRYELTDKEWELIRPLIPISHTGRPQKNILMLVMKYHESNCKDKSILGTIDRAIDSSIQLRSKKDLIHGFISTVNAATDVDRDWQSYVQQQKQQELEQIIAKEKLKPAEAQRFVANAFRDGALKTTGTDIDQILPPVSRFGVGNRMEKKKTGAYAQNEKEPDVYVAYNFLAAATELALPDRKSTRLNSSH